MHNKTYTVQKWLILKSEGIQCVFHKVLVSVKPFQAEDLIVTAVMAWKSEEWVIVDFFPLYSHDR